MTISEKKAWQLWFAKQWKRKRKSPGEINVERIGLDRYYPGQKNRFSREIHEMDLEVDHVISCDIGLHFDIDQTCGICHGQRESLARVLLRACREKFGPRPIFKKFSHSTKYA